MQFKKRATTHQVHACSPSTHVLSPLLPRGISRSLSAMSTGNEKDPIERDAKKMCYMYTKSMIQMTDLLYYLSGYVNIRFTCTR